MARIAVGGFQHETNTFSATPARLADFVEGGGWPGLQRGEQMLSALAGMNLPISGAIAAIEAAGHEAVPLIWAAATPSGRVEDQAWDHVLALFLEQLQQCGPVDALYLDLHGAMATASADDGEGLFLHMLRRPLGSLPIAASLDLHANVSETMFECCDLMVGYRTYPHVDMADSGERTVHALLRMMAAGQPPQRCLLRLATIMPLTSQCTLVEPAASLYATLARLEHAFGVTLTLTLGFCLADVADCGASILAYGEDMAAVKQAAETMQAAFLQALPAFETKVWEAGEAVQHALALANAGKYPVVLADTQDNPGGGGQMDTTGLLQELIRQDVRGAVVAMIFDPDAAALAHETGIGKHIDLDLGGKLSGPGSGPATGRYFIEQLSEGSFTGTGPMWGGLPIRLGKMALLRTGRSKGIQVIVASRKMQAGDRAILTHLDIVPRACQIIVLKSSVHFRADFDPIAAATLVVASPGAVTARLEELQYERLRPGTQKLGVDTGMQQQQQQ